VRGERDLGAESMFEYGSRAGFWRLMRIFAERNLPMTVYACALALERNPPAAAAIKAAGYDICCHGWRWIEHFKLSEAEERKHIQRAIESLQKTVGQRPLGWYCRYAPSINTRRLLIEEGGFLYDSDAYNDDLPYYVATENGPHLVIPYTLANNDVKWANGNIGTGEEFFSHLKDGFDVLYAEGRMAPKLMNIGMHMRLLGHPARAAGLIRFLDYVVAQSDVWVQAHRNRASLAEAASRVDGESVTPSPQTSWPGSSGRERERGHLSRRSAGTGTLARRAMTSAGIIRVSPGPSRAPPPGKNLQETSHRRRRHPSPRLPPPRPEKRPRTRCLPAQRSAGNPRPSRRNLLRRQPARWRGLRSPAQTA
jgi:allantoinase